MDDIDDEVIEQIPATDKMIAKVGYGEIFGQVALQTKEPRNASILALDDVALMIIKKREFEVIRDYYSYEFSERKTFLTTILP